MKSANIPKSIAIFVLFLGHVLNLALSFTAAPTQNRRRQGFSFLSMSTMSPPGSAPQLKSILKKPSKVLTVGLQCDFPESISKSELNILSMQLRKVKATSVWCSNLDILKEVASEQATAKGSFPGPLPVIYYGSEAHVATAIANGASAVVLSASSDAISETEVIWRVQNSEEVQSVLAKAPSADAFLIHASGDVNEVMSTLPLGSLCIVEISPMQPDGAEITQGKEFQKLGCASVLMKSALVGDSEDLPYSQYLVGGLTSKASSEFKFSGLTGSTNGHFGGIQANGKAKWRRVEQMKQNN